MTGELPAIDCACESIRRAARLVTQLYADEMGQSLEPSQFSLLTILSHRPGGMQASLGRALGLDKTTMSRNLRVMQKNGWIELAKTEDQRARGYRLTLAGEQLLAAAKPRWKRAQQKLRAALKDGEWKSAMKTFGLVARAAQGARDKR